MVAVSAFASHHTTSTSSNYININPSTLQTSILRSSRTTTKQHQKYNNQLHKQSATKLHLTIPRGGAAAAAAASTSILSDLSSKLSTLTSTPTGSFNTALVILGAATAVLKIYNKVDANSDGGDKKEVQKKDPKVKSLQMRFLAVFWLLRMADWLQVSLFMYTYITSGSLGLYI
jgi:hypothetical protein